MEATLTPLQWTIGAGFLVVAGFLRFMSGPAFYRRKPAEFLSDIAATLAGQPQGSILIMDHKRSERFLQFRKPADTGKVEQAIVFGFPEVEWSRAFFDEVVARVDESGFPYGLAAGYCDRATADNNRVPPPLATLAPVKHGPMAYQVRAAYRCEGVGRSRGPEYVVGHVGTLERYGKRARPNWPGMGYVGTLGKTMAHPGARS